MNDRDHCLYEIDACERILRGERVNGVKLGDAGINADWVWRTLAISRSMLAQMDAAGNYPMPVS